MINIDGAKEAADFATLGLTDIYISSGSINMIPDTADTDSPWSKPLVREAVEYALDKETIVKAFGYGFWQPAYQVPDHNNLAYDPAIQPRQYDVAKAKQLLTEAGYPNGFKTTIIVGPQGISKDFAVALQSYLAKVGIEAELEFTDFGKFISYMVGTWPNAVIITGLPSQPNYNITLQFINGIFGQSWQRTPEYVQACQASLTAPSLDTTKVRAVADLLIKDASLIPLHEPIDGLAVRPFVMDTGATNRSLVNIWNTEDAWLNN